LIYDWRTDSYGSWLFWLRWKALTGGFARPEMPHEMYWAEAAGVIP